MSIMVISLSETYLGFITYLIVCHVMWAALATFLFVKDTIRDSLSDANQIQRIACKLNNFAKDIPQIFAGNVNLSDILRIMQEGFDNLVDVLEQLAIQPRDKIRRTHVWLGEYDERIGRMEAGLAGLTGGPVALLGEKDRECAVRGLKECANQIRAGAPSVLSDEWSANILAVISNLQHLTYQLLRTEIPGDAHLLRVDWYISIIETYLATILVQLLSLAAALDDYDLHATLLRNWEVFTVFAELFQVLDGIHGYFYQEVQRTGSDTEVIEWPGFERLSSPRRPLQPYVREAILPKDLEEVYGVYDKTRPFVRAFVELCLSPKPPLEDFSQKSAQKTHSHKEIVDFAA
ncbi:MAG: hypothetical protein LBC42_01875 [Puniceicoccales bacterium]|nr:hypothetical protein [Puniceicoccales bacterium]